MCTAVTQQTLNRANTKHGALHLAGSGGVKSTVCMYTAVTQQTLSLAGSAGMKSTDCTMSTAVMQQTLSTANTEHVALCLQRAPTVQCSKTANTEHVALLSFVPLMATTAAWTDLC